MKRFSLLALGAGLTLLSSGDARAATGENSFTPTNFVMPIYSIMLANGLTTNVPIYACHPTVEPPLPGTDAGPTVPDAGAASDCLVDMADSTALANLFAEPADIPPGPYDRIVVGTCESNSAFVAKLKGSVDISGTTYYTTSGVPTISPDPADLDYTSINYSGCGNTIMLPTPITVSEGDTITVSAFFTLQNLSWVLDHFSPGLGGCATAPGGGFNVCSGLPVLVGYIGTAAPVLDSYYITEDQNDLTASKAAGQVLLLSSGGEPFSGFLRRVYSATSVDPHVSYDVPLREITKNSDSGLNAGLDAGLDAAASDAGTDGGTFSSYDIYSIGDPAQETDKYRVRFPRFELRDHTGTLSTANGTAQVPYRAIKR